MFTHHEMLLLQNTERRLQREVEARQGGPLAALRWAKRVARRAEPVTRPAPARASSPPPAGASSPPPARARSEPAAPGRPAGTLAACAASGGSAL